MDKGIYIGLGGNLGNREANMAQAIAGIAHLPQVRLIRQSRVYDSAPFGPPQPRYLNAVVEIECGLSPMQLLSGLKAIEAQLGRVSTERWLPRPIDLDILLWNTRVIEVENLRVPHPEIQNRRFVLEPLCDLAPSYVHPLLNQTMKALLLALPSQDVCLYRPEHP